MGIPSEHFRYVLDQIQRASPEHLSHLYVDEELLNQLFQAISQPSSEITPDLKHRMILAIGNNASGNTLSQVVDNLFKEGFLPPMERAEVIQACSKSRDFFPTFVARASEEDLERFLFNSNAVAGFIERSSAEKISQTIKSLAASHPEMVHRLFTSTFNETPFISLLFKNYRFQLVDELIKSPDLFYLNAFRDYLETNNLDSYSTSKIDLSFIADCPAPSVKVFLSQINYGKTRLEDFLENKNLKPIVLKRLAEFPNFLIETGLIQKYSKDVYTNSTQLKDLFKNIPGLSSYLPPAVALKLKTHEPLASFIPLMFEEGLNQLDQIAGEAFVQEEWRYLKEAEREVAVRFLLKNKDASSEFVLFVLTRSEYSPILIAEHRERLMTLLVDPSFVLSMYRSANVRSVLPSLDVGLRETFVRTVFQLIFHQNRALIDDEPLLLKNLELLLSLKLRDSDFLSIFERKTPFLDFLSEISDVSRPFLLPLAKEAVRTGLPHTETALRFCIYWHNRDLLKLLLHQERVEKSSANILQDLAKMPDTKTADLFFEHGLDLKVVLAPFKPEDPSKTLLSHLVENNDIQIVKWLFDKGLTLSDTLQAEQLFKGALKSGNLELVELIWVNIKELSDLQVEYPRDLNLSGDRQEAQKAIERYALFSPLPVLFRLIEEHHRELEDELKETIALLPFLVRFPSESFRGEVSGNLKQENAYLETSYRYAKGNAGYIHRIIENQMSWGQLLSEITEERKKENKGLSKSYGTLRKDTMVDQGTPLIYQTKPDSQGTPDDVRVSRYSNAWNQFFKFKEEREIRESSYSLRSTPDKIIFTYPFAANKPVTITNLCIGWPEGILAGSFGKGVYWQHSTPEVLKESEASMNDLHERIMTFELKEDNRGEFFDLVARGYWLIASLCETERGTPHNAMMWLNLVYQKHDLPPPIPKTEYFFLDNMMLVMPVEQAVEKWHSFFEPIPQKFLKKG